MRDGTVIFEGSLASLRRFKDDVKSVKQGYECGIGVEKFQDIKVGDTIAVGDAGSELAWKSHSVAIEGLLPTDKLMFTSVGAKKSRYYIDEISVVKN